MRLPRPSSPPVMASNFIPHGNDVVVKSDTLSGSLTQLTTVSLIPNPVTPPACYVYRCTMTNGNASCTAVVTSGITARTVFAFRPMKASSTCGFKHRPASHHGLQRLPQQHSPAMVRFRQHHQWLSRRYPRAFARSRLVHRGGDGAYIFATDGHQIGHIKFQLIANLCFGGPEYKTLFMVGQPNVVSMPVLVAGTPAMLLQSNFDGTNFNLNWNAPSTGFVCRKMIVWMIPTVG